MNQVTTDTITTITHAISALQAAQAMIIKFQDASSGSINPADISTVLGELKTSSDGIVAAMTATPPAA